MMFEAPLDLKRARILVSNDDGIHANGIRAMEKVARTLSDDVWVVAPEVEQSGAGHSLTLRDPLRIRRVDERHFSVSGTPTDSVLLAIRQILGDHPPDLVLSGINRGGNLGEDVTYSGTIAAAMEGTLLGIPSIAMSQVTRADSRTKWDTAEHFATDIVRRLTAVPWERNVFMNVNFPDLEIATVAGTEVCFQGRRKLGDQLEERHDPNGRPYYWIGPQRGEDPTRPDTDLAAITGGRISVTPLSLDLTHDAMVRRLRDEFA